MYQLYIANKNYSSWSLRSWVLLRELEIPFEEKLQIFEAENYERFREFSPTGLVPCLVHGWEGEEPIAVWDTMAIAEFLAERHPEVWPSDERARAWARSAAAEMHSGFPHLRQVCSMNCGIRVELHEVAAPLQKELDRLDELWADGLERFGGPFLAGERFTNVDAFYVPVAFRIQGYGLQLSERSHAYADRLLALPSVVDWYESALAETWRDEVHEDDWRAVGQLVEDRRVAAKPR